MAETASDTQHTIAVEIEVPDPRSTINRVKHWLLASDSTRTGASQFRTAGSHAVDRWGQSSPLYVDAY